MRLARSEPLVFKTVSFPALASLPGVFFDLADQERLSSAEGHREGGRVPQLLEDAVAKTGGVPAGLRPVAEIAR